MDEVTRQEQSEAGDLGGGVFAPTWMHSKQRFGVRPGQGAGNLNFKSCPK